MKKLFLAFVGIAFSTSVLAAPAAVIQTVIVQNVQEWSWDFRWSFPPGVQFARSQVAWGYDNSGTGAVTQFAANTPVQPVYNPSTGKNLGYQIFTTIQNFLRNSNTPATQTINLAAGDHVFQCESSDGLSVVSLSGGVTQDVVCPVATAGYVQQGFYFTLGGAEDVTFTIPSAVAKHAVITSGSTWTVPDDWVVGGSIDCIGAGGNGANATASTSSGGGGGSGTHGKITSNSGIVRNAVLNISIAAAGSGAATTLQNNVGSTVLSCPAGTSASGITGGTAGSAGSVIGDTGTRFGGANGGAGVNADSRGGGAGAGSGGPSGIGKTGSGGGAAFGGGGGGTDAQSATSGSSGIGGIGPAGDAGGTVGTSGAPPGNGTNGSGGGGASSFASGNNGGNGSIEAIWTDDNSGLTYGPASGAGGGGFAVAGTNNGGTTATRGLGCGGAGGGVKGVAAGSGQTGCPGALYVTYAPSSAVTYISVNARAFPGPKVITTNGTGTKSSDNGQANLQALTGLKLNKGGTIKACFWATVAPALTPPYEPQDGGTFVATDSTNDTLRTNRMAINYAYKDDPVFKDRAGTTIVAQGINNTTLTSGIDPQNNYLTVGPHCFVGRWDQTGFIASAMDGSPVSIALGNYKFVGQWLMREPMNILYFGYGASAGPPLNGNLVYVWITDRLVSGVQMEKMSDLSTFPGGSSP